VKLIYEFQPPPAHYYLSPSCIHRNPLTIHFPDTKLSKFFMLEDSHPNWDATLTQLVDIFSAGRRFFCSLIKFVSILSSLVFTSTLSSSSHNVFEGTREAITTCTHRINGLGSVGGKFLNKIAVIYEFLSRKADAGFQPFHSSVMMSFSTRNADSNVREEFPCQLFIYNERSERSFMKLCQIFRKSLLHYIFK
jgi:hypothetical protein